MKYILFAALVALLGCSFLRVNEESNPRSPASQDTGLNVAGTPPKIFPLQKLDFANLRRVVLANMQSTGKPPKTIEDVLSALRPQYTEYLRFYTLMYASFSLHESSYENPRVIAFGPDARFVLTFNGNKHQVGGNSFESMEFSVADQSFKFREITFKTDTYDPGDLQLDKSEIEVENSRVVISKDNPAKCQSCHLPNNSPVWNNSFVWPGAYGSMNNNLYLSFDWDQRSPADAAMWAQTNQPTSLGQLYRLRAGLADTEVQGMIRYLKAKASKDPANRYQYLPAQISEAAFVKSANGVPLSQLNLSDDYARERTRVQAGPAWPSKPNLFFQQNLMHLNNLRLIRRLRLAGIPSGAYRNLPWNLLQDTTGTETRSIREMAGRIAAVLDKANLSKVAPNEDQIVHDLTLRVNGEMGMQVERAGNMAQNFTPDPNSDPFEMVTPADWTGRRLNMNWLGDSFVYYTPILNVQKATVAKIAMMSDAENIAMLETLYYLLKDRGLDLEDFELTPRQFTLSFYRNGLAEAAQDLGIPVSNGNL